MTITYIGPSGLPPTATPTPRPLPTATPTPRPRSPEYTAGLGYARSEELGDRDSDVYATAFAAAKDLGLDNTEARNYASGLAYHRAVALSIAGSAVEADNVAEAYAAAFRRIVEDGADVSVVDALGQASEAVRRSQGWWPFYGGEPGSGSFAELYAEVFTRTEESGIDAHGYATVYAARMYLGDGEETATDFAEAQVRGLNQSRSESLQERIVYSTNYRRGYSEALWRAEPEQGFTQAHKVESWASAYAQAYDTGYNRARNNGWNDPERWAHVYARLFAYGKVDLSFPDQSAFLNADSYFRGANAAAERGLDGDTVFAYTWDYYSAYFDTKVRRGWTEDRAHAYAVAFAEAKLEGRGEEEAKDYARAYEKAFTEAKEGGSTDAEADVYAKAFAEAEVGAAPTPTPAPSE